MPGIKNITGKGMLYFTLTCLSYLPCIAATAQSGPFSLANVPEGVKNKADIILHSETTDLEIESLDKAILRVDKIFTVMNEGGKDDLVFSANTSKYVSLEDAEVRVYDANGKQTGKYKKKDMRTSATGEGLIDDGYVTYYYVSTTSYPITVEFKYEIRIKGTLNIPSYSLVEAKEGVVESSFTVHVPVDMNLRYKAKNTTIQPAISDEGKYKVYKWATKNLPPPNDEEGSVGSGTDYPHIMLALDKFSCYGLEGDLSSWKSLGLWIRNLYDGLDNLAPDRQQFFVSLVKDAENDKEKIKRIYNYLQENFRYVSIQLGIGGLKPFPADFTDQKKYGDCKGLSNYMKAALKAIGIKSYVAIINAEYNEEPVDPDFPSNDFNHVILCVPGQKDSIWLECTSPITDFNELGPFTENRNALLITEDGGFLVPTPKSHPESNYFGARTTVSMSDDFSALSETVFTIKGDYWEMMDHIIKQKRDDQKEYLVMYYGFKQPDDFELTRAESSGRHQANLKMAIRKIPEFSAGDKLFISPRMYKLWPKALPKADGRKLDFYFPCPFQKTDTTIFKLPAGVKPDALPKENEIKCSYASFTSRFWYNEAENAIYSVALLVLKQNKIPASDYASVKKFFDDVMQADSQKFVIKK